MPPQKYSEGGSMFHFSGHKKHMGLNVQAACTADYKFTHCEPNWPGSKPDRLAWQTSAIQEYAKKLPANLYIVGDGAYPIDEHVLTPFLGSSLAGLGEYQDSYNFYQSQMRMAVEQSFGMLIARWRVLRAPLANSLDRNRRIIKVAFMLHNFCQKQNDGPPLMDSLPAELINGTQAYFSRVLEEFVGEECDGKAKGRPVTNVDRTARRTGIVDQLRLHNLRRPT